MGICSIHEYSIEIELAKQYCFTHLYSVFSCCSMWNPEPFRALLSELLEVEGGGSRRGIMLETAQDSIWTEQQEKTLYK